MDRDLHPDCLQDSQVRASFDPAGPIRNGAIRLESIMAHSAISQNGSAEYQITKAAKALVKAVNWREVAIEVLVGVTLLALLSMVAK